MEKYSNYRDAFTGINPFINPKRQRLTLKNCFKFIYKLPFLILLFFNINTLPLLIKIKYKKKVKKLKGLTLSNSSSFLDYYIFKHIFCLPVENMIHSDKNKDRIFLPEGCTSNNKSILYFDKNIKGDNTIGLRYSDGCIFMYGSWLYFLIYFLGTDNWVEIDYIEKGTIEDLCKVTGLLQVEKSKIDKNNFLKDMECKGK